MADEKVLKAPRGLAQPARALLKEIVSSLLAAGPTLRARVETDPEVAVRVAQIYLRTLREALELSAALAPPSRKSTNADALRADLRRRLARFVAARRPGDVPKVPHAGTAAGDDR